MICPSCGNEFIQQFLCTTCGAQKLHDHTLKAIEKENAALRQALRAIANPIAAMQKAVPKGHLFNGAMAVQIAADPAYYQGIAQEALAEIERGEK